MRRLPVDQPKSNADVLRLLAEAPGKPVDYPARVIAGRVHETAIIAAQSNLSHQHSWCIRASYVESSNAKTVNASPVETGLGAEACAISGCPGCCDYAIVHMTKWVRDVNNVMSQ
jgi:hypothetical protein